MLVKNLSKIDFNRVTRILNLTIPSQGATFGPPVGPILGQFRLKIKSFCDDFNKESKSFPKNLPLNITIYVYKDLSFNYIIKTPSIMFLLQNSLNSNTKNKLDYIDIYKIILIKKLDLTYIKNKSILKSLLSTLKSMKLVNKLS